MKQNNFRMIKHLRIIYRLPLQYRSIQEYYKYSGHVLPPKKNLCFLPSDQVSNPNQTLALKAYYKY